MTATDKSARADPARDTDAERVADRERLDTTAYQMMQLLIRPERFGATNADLASALGVTPRRIQQIKQSPSFRRAFAALTERRLLTYLPQVDAALIASASKKGHDGAQDRRLYYQMVGRLPLPGAKGTGDERKALTQRGAERLTAALQRVEQLGPTSASVIEQRAARKAESPEDRDFDDDDDASSGQ